MKKRVCLENESFIIALNGKCLDLGISNNMPPEIFRALYAMGDPYGTLEKNEKQDYYFKDQGYYRTIELLKKNESKVSTTFFLDESNRHISGLIFSTNWIGSASTAPDYCYVRNIKNEKQTDFGFEKFMQTYNYTENEISMKA